MGNYGTAVTTLLGGGAKPMLSLLTLPTRGVESGIALVPGKPGSDWTVRFSRADERVYSWVSQTDRGAVQFRTEQTLKPSRSRSRRRWRNALSAAGPRH